MTKNENAAPSAPATYTYDQVSAAVNGGIDLIARDPHLSVGERDRDLLNLAVNAAMTLLKSPGATLDEVIEANYETSAEEVRSWI